MSVLHYNAGETIMGRWVHFTGEEPDYGLSTWAHRVRCGNCQATSIYTPDSPIPGFCDHSMSNEDIVAYLEEHWFETVELAAQEGF